MSNVDKVDLTHSLGTPLSPHFLQWANYINYNQAVVNLSQQKIYFLSYNFMEPFIIYIK